MEKMIFIKEASTGKKVAIVSECGALRADGCSVNVKESVFNDAMKLGLVDEYITGGKRNKTRFFRFGAITLLTIKDSRATVFDSYIGDEVWIGEKFKQSGFQYHYSKSKDEQKHTIRIQLSDVMRTDRNKEKKRGRHAVAFNKFLWDMILGKAGNPTDLYVYDGKESHHEKHSWDNRIKSTMNLTKEEHREHHDIISSASHQVVVEINTLEELEAFLEYLRNN